VARRCCLTVDSERKRSLAIWALLCPLATSSSISRWRTVSTSRSAGTSSVTRCSGNDDLASGGDLRGAGYLVQLHSGVDEAPGTEPQGRSGERQIQVQTEDENGDLGADLVDEPYALREVLHPARIEDGAHRYDAPRRGGSPEMHPEDPP
jgi:hypothetical protein